MSNYTAKVLWQRQEHETFIDNQYSRGHTWYFDGGISVAASSSPEVVPLPYSVEANVDPEEAFVASLSSCHMLFFLAFAAKKRWLVERYCDEATGLMEKNTEGKVAMTQVTLKPHILFSGDKQPTPEEIDNLHHLAHENCFIANSVKTLVTILQP